MHFRAIFAHSVRFQGDPAIPLLYTVSFRPSGAHILLSAHRALRQVCVPGRASPRTYTRTKNGLLRPKENLHWHVG